ncbi:hypothetical protein ACP70R_045671 [Stipagrostis hirtigluma subsp. patula]
MADASRSSGAGGGAGAGAGRRDRAVIEAAEQAQSAPLLFGENRVEIYLGENEELQKFDVLISPQKPPPPMSVLLGDEPLPAGSQLGPTDLEACLRQGEWDRSLEILDLMVQGGQALNCAVNTEENPSDIFRAHPELVLLLRGQSYFDIKRQGDALRSNSYYQKYINAVYPDDTSTGSPFVDETLMATIRSLAKTRKTPSGRHCFSDGKETCQAVHDYLKIYFPAFKPDVTSETRLWEFGEKLDPGVRCLLCHHVFERYNKTRFRYHLVGSDVGRQIKCPAVNNYISGLVQKILADEGYNPDGTPRKATNTGSTLPPPVPPPLPPSNGATNRGATSTMISSPDAVDDDDDDGAVPPSSPPPPRDDDTGVTAPPTSISAPLPDDDDDDAGATASTTDA